MSQTLYNSLLQWTDGLLPSPIAAVNWYKIMPKSEPSFWKKKPKQCYK